MSNIQFCEVLAIVVCAFSYTYYRLDRTSKELTVLEKRLCTVEESIDRIRIYLLEKD